MSERDSARERDVQGQSVVQEMASVSGAISGGQLVKEQDQQNICDEFLEYWSLLDEGMSPSERLLRWQRFRRVKFGDQVSDDNKRRYMRDLIPYENSFAAEQDSVGNVTQWPFTIRLTANRKIRSRAITYPPVARRWLREQCEVLERKGVIRQVAIGEPEPQCVMTIVLVPEGQSGQDFRMCFNAIELNAITEVTARQVPETMQIIDALSSAQFFSLIDLKGAFHNVIIEPESVPLLGFVTQDGLYTWLRMPFGCVNAPAHLQSILELVVHTPTRLPVEIYYDDITPYGNEEELVWNTSLATIARLANARFLINLGKSGFLLMRAPLLGLVVEKGLYCIGEKAMKRLFKVALPTNLRELQALLGRLNFASRLIPGYKRIVRPIEKLLKRDTEVKWSSECTEALNKLLELVAQRLVLAVYQPEVDCTVFVSFDDEFAEVVLVQLDEHKRERPIRMIGRVLTEVEQREGELERYLRVMHWGIRKCSRYTAFHAGRILLALRRPEHVALVRDMHVHPKVRAKVLDLLSYGSEFVARENEWDFGGSLARMLSNERVVTESHVVPPVVEHRDIVLAMPKKVKRLTVELAPVVTRGMFVGYFDGGCRGRITTGGFLVFGLSGELMDGAALYFGGGTNNEAEANACRALHESLVRCVPRGASVAVYGDSALILGFLTGVNTPSKYELIQAMRACKQLVWEGDLVVTYILLGRDRNHLCDTLCNWAFQHKTSASVFTIAPGWRADSIVSNQAAMLPASSVEAETPVSCVACEGLVNRQSDLSYRQCWGCGCLVHIECQPQPERASEMPWYCRSCKPLCRQRSDITCDLQLLRFLVEGVLPDDVLESTRVSRVAQWVKWKDGRLHLQGRGGIGWVEVPPLYLRDQIVTKYVESMGVPAAPRVVELIRQTYDWRGMRSECERVCRQHVAAQKERAQYMLPPYLITTDKGFQPFSTWAIDCIVGLSPPTADGSTTVVVAIDAWSKWIEYRILKQLDSVATSAFLYEDVICRYGVPLVVRSDLGTEFAGEFSTLCTYLGISHRSISVLNPRANGLIERYNREIKSGLRRFLTLCPGSHWSELLPDVVMALRLLPTTTTGRSAFELVYKQTPQPPVPIEQAVRATPETPFVFDDAAVERLEEQHGRMLEFWDGLRGFVQERLAAVDQRMIRQYYRKTNLAKVDVRTIFEPGDRCLHRQKRKGKLLPKAQGPYIFIKYNTDERVTATIQDPRGREMACSVANLLPMRALTRPSRLLAVESRDGGDGGNVVGEVQVDWDDGEDDHSTSTESLAVQPRKRMRSWDEHYWPSDDEVEPIASTVEAVVQEYAPFARFEDLALASSHLATWGILSDDGGTENAKRCGRALLASLQAGVHLVALACPKCEYPHVDQASYAVNAHTVHRCHHCKYRFRESRATVSNVLCELKPEIRGGLLLFRSQY